MEVASYKKYPKINTIWKRDENTHKILTEQFSRKEFKALDLWEISEKMDGTNIRVFFRPHENKITFEGRHDDSDIPRYILEELHKIFNTQSLLKCFDKGEEIVLYGEGYDNRIGNILYNIDTGFMLFDVLVDDWWLERDNVHDVAVKLNIPHVPSFGLMTTYDAISFVKDGMAKGYVKSHINGRSDVIPEGIVARSVPLMLFRDHTPVMWKLKVRDYE